MASGGMLPDILVLTDGVLVRGGTQPTLINVHRHSLSISISLIVSICLFYRQDTNL